MPKRILSLQSKFKFCMRTSLPVLSFPISLLKRNNIENDKLLKEKFLLFFITSKNRDYFHKSTFVSYIC